MYTTLAICGVSNREFRKEHPIKKPFIHSGKESVPHPTVQGSTDLSCKPPQAWKPANHGHSIHIRTQAIAERKHELTSWGLERLSQLKRPYLVFESRSTPGIFQPTGQVIHGEALMASRVM